ncbi:cation transporter [Acinetobacter soli]|uniref:cation efflux protein, CzcI-like n=1 Tax=Acinetobacter soli TaxID=487316 RepID=UPI001BC880B7|nr:cation efflux protein, CzcI-like [Acinetobacter soli]MDQ8995897.1 cation transporter [Acinetobacter soli]
MKRSTVWITVLMSLFMFQTFWNVAAAFCAHESTTATVAYHFGHHAPVTESHAAHSPSVSTASNPAVFQDHHDHLPTCLHVLSIAEQQSATEPLRLGQLIQQHYSWANAYQSPHLFHPNPPPILTPLLVG